jgi:hypothetical protein
MRLLGTGNGGVVAIVAYRDKRFQGYGVRTDDGWVCIASLGMHWTKLRCRTAEDCRTMLRTTCHANRFDDVRDLDALTSLIAKLPPYLQPGIMPEQIAGIPVRLPKLHV